MITDKVFRQARISLLLTSMISVRTLRSQSIPSSLQISFNRLNNWLKSGEVILITWHNGLNCFREGEYLTIKTDLNCQWLFDITYRSLQMQITGLFIFSGAFSFFIFPGDVDDSLGCSGLFDAMMAFTRTFTAGPGAPSISSKIKQQGFINCSCSPPWYSPFLLLFTDSMLFRKVSGLRSSLYF